MQARLDEMQRLIDIQTQKKTKKPSVDYDCPVPLFPGCTILVSNKRLVKARKARSITSYVSKIFTALVPVKDSYRFNSTGTQSKLKIYHLTCLIIIML